MFRIRFAQILNVILIIKLGHFRRTDSFHRSTFVVDLNSDGASTLRNDFSWPPKFSSWFENHDFLLGLWGDIVIETQLATAVKCNLFFLVG